jgi:hypothetical protein
VSLQTTRRRLILGAATLTGAARASPAAPARPQRNGPSPSTGPQSLSALLAAGRDALASSQSEA